MIKRKKIVMAFAAITIGLFIICLAVSFGVFNEVIKRNKRYNDGGNPLADMIVSDNKDTEEWLPKQNKQEIGINATDGTRLSGVIIYSSKPSGKLAILIHGHRNDIYAIGKYARMYLDMGYDVFMADNRAHGKSGGKYTGMGWLDRLDWQVWIHTLIKKQGANTQIVLHGISMGASAAMMLSGEAGLPQQIKAIIEDCGYTSAYDEIKHGMKKFYLPAFPILNMVSAYTQLKAGYSLTEASALQAVAKSTIPTLFIHGEDDAHTPVWMAHKLYEAATCPKELWIVPGTLHAMSYHNNPEKYKQKVVDFLQNYITQTGK